MCFLATEVTRRGRVVQIESADVYHIALVNKPFYNGTSVYAVSGCVSGAGLSTPRRSGTTLRSECQCRSCKVNRSIVAELEAKLKQGTTLAWWDETNLSISREHLVRHLVVPLERGEPPASDGALPGPVDAKES